MSGCVLIAQAIAEPSGPMPSYSVPCTGASMANETRAGHALLGGADKSGAEEDVILPGMRKLVDVIVRSPTQQAVTSGEDGRDPGAFQNQEANSPK